MRVWVYVDGFNLYFGALKGTPYRWLDLGKLCDLLLSSHRVEGIRYFTAMVSARAGKPGKEIRQRKYVEAIQTDPRVSVHLGHYLTSIRQAKNANPPPPSVSYVHVEEKGSDVNLASYLLLDAFDRRYEMGVVISNDSDLVEPIRLVRQEFKVPVGVFHPHTTPSSALRKAASWMRPIRGGPLGAARFPPVLEVGNKKRLRKPKKW